MASTVCRFFLQGRCTAGDNCRFRHSALEETSPDPQKVNTPCRFFFTDGSCKNGQYCQFSHTEPVVVQADLSNVYKPVRITAPVENGAGAESSQWVTISKKGGIQEGPSDAAPSHLSTKASAWGTAPPSDTGILTNSGNAVGHYDATYGGYDDYNSHQEGFYVESHGPDDGGFTADEIAAISNEMAAINFTEEQAPYSSPNSGFDPGMEQGWNDPGMGQGWNTEHYDPSLFAQPGDYEGGESEEYQSNKLCQFFIAGDCRFADQCRFVHGEKCPYCGQHCLHPDFPDDSARHVLECEEKQGLNVRKEASRGIQCDVCYEDVIGMRRKFGLLNGCSHAFCLECIRSWRTTYDQSRNVVRACPVCREISHFITPSPYWPKSEEEKNEITEAYKHKLNAIPCKHFNYGAGTCPFGTSCFYAHLNRDGTEAPPQAPRTYVSADGAMTAVTEVSLADFLQA
eukprot:TRINITY_DN3077_c0_g1_i2.p1 TRINITY_DN3077_c0_g1~~TRINITY_DN3077_c0_g1_i2.p1  ORF type:complete len:456 (+),score=35.05 TRINITY_DN3077_c0_g1_i2:414-1781(+)